MTLESLTRRTISEILPHTTHTFDLRLTAELTLRADFAGHTRHLGRETYTK